MFLEYFWNVFGPELCGRSKRKRLVVRKGPIVYKSLPKLLRRFKWLGI